MEATKGEMKALKEDAKRNDVSEENRRSERQCQNMVERGKDEAKELSEKMKHEVPYAQSSFRRKAETINTMI